MTKNKRKYWYLYTYRCCVLCGIEDNTKERIYFDEQERPDDIFARHKYEEFACGCHFI